MAVILFALLFLFGAPALLLGTGKLIQRIGRRPADRPRSQASADSWYYRPVQPTFGNGQGNHQEPAPAPVSPDDQPWYVRPSKPVFARPAWLRRPTFAGHGTD